MLSSATLRRFALGLALTWLGCGAKTGLHPPDASVEGASDAFVRFDACVAGRFDLARREARMLFVIDRSGSMAQPLVAAERLSRWDAMRAALARSLPRVEREVQIGALVFPRVPTSPVLAAAQACEQLPGAGLDVEPRAGRADSLLRVLGDHSPGGATPTNAAVQRAARYLQAHQARGLAQYLVLATDGAPNCNGALDTRTCTCLNPTGCAGGTEASRNCLDDVGAVGAIEAARRAGINTYVIGIDGDLDQRFVAVLDRMAVAGGRPLQGARRYYSIASQESLSTAFEDIQRTVVRCAFVTPSRPDDPDRIEVRAGGAPVARDPARQNGWDWTDRDYGELTLFGAACERVLAGGVGVEATVACGR